MPPAQPEAVIISAITILATGAITGYIIGITKSVLPDYKASTAIIGVIFGGVPVAFLGPTNATHWAYPVGIGLGFWATRFNEMARAISLKWETKAPKKEKVLGWFAWFELAVFSSAVLVSIFSAVLSYYVDFNLSEKILSKKHN